MERTVRTEARGDYGTMVADLWERLATGLTRLERVAEASPSAIVAEARDELPTLQYSLHATAELAHGIRPPAAAAEAHRELVSALAQARDATAEIAEAAEDDDEDLIEALAPEWRGALFRVRLARLRALEVSPMKVPEEAPPTAPEVPPVSRMAIAATALVLTGAVLFTAGAVLAAWPLWGAGLTLFGGGFVLFRP
jgi:hypothetical protein